MFKMLFKYRPLWIFVVPLLGLIATPTNTLVVAQSPVFILNIGDSRMDEYYPPAEDAPSRDGCPASLPGCLSYGWVEQLMYFRGTYLSYGQYGVWDFPRRHGYAYNLALSGVAYEGQSDIANTNFYGALNTIFAQQPAFDIIFVGLGANDFATYRADGYQEVAYGNVTPQQKIDKILASFNTLMAAVRAKAPTTPVRVHLITPNLIDSIAAGLGYTPAQRNLVMQAMVGVNNGMMAYDASDPYTQALDFEPAFRAPYIGIGADGYWNYLGYHINFFQTCDDPRICGAVEPASAPHPGIWGEGMIANWHLAVIAQTLGINIPPLTDAEMLQLAGLSVVPTDTPVPTATYTDTPIPTATYTDTPVPTDTDTPIPTATYTDTPVPTNTDTPVPTATYTDTPVPTYTDTPVPTATYTDTPIPTNTDTPVPTATYTNTPVPTATYTNTPIPTATYTNTPVPTATYTRTPTPTATYTRTPSPTPTPVLSAYIRIHIVGQTDQIIPLPSSYQRVSGSCTGNVNYMGIQEPGRSFRKYVCWS